MNSYMRYKTPIAWAAFWLCALAVPVQAQSVASMKTTVQKALAGNPEVAARYHALMAASDGVAVAKGARLPRVDLSGDIGHESKSYTTGPNNNLNRAGLNLAVSQVLWDGLGTRHEIARNSHERVSRYFDLLETTEQTALEAARALYDVQRFRGLVALAEENYVQHRNAAEKIKTRVKAGVGRGVDLEQALARLALAESNLTAELANLHDVSARYQRIVGEPPEDGREALATLSDDIPAETVDGLRLALSRSHAVSASVESLRAAQAAVRTRQSAMQPRVEGRLRGGVGRNLDGVATQRSDATAEVVMNWTLFDGNADQARVRQQTNLVNQAADLRDKTCRDARQTTLIAYNDVQKLSDQIGMLERNTQAIERAREAYRQQFDIGQRSLLDVLNAENEAYTAQRAVLNAKFDHAVAYARTQAALSQLNTRLGIARATQAEPDADWNAGTDGALRCPSQIIATTNADLQALARRRLNATPAATAAPTPEPVVLAAVLPQPAATPMPMATPAANVTTTTPAAPTPSFNPAPAAPALAEFPPSLVQQWANAWQTKSFSRYAAFYQPGFKGAEGSDKAWAEKRQRALGKPGVIGVKVSDVAVSMLPDGKVETRFKQDYTSSNYKDSSDKVLTWQRLDGQWLIVAESNR
jgi:outer membrane protein, adhesin transport system